MKNTIKFILTISLSISVFLLGTKTISAQEISLSVSPPITEITIQPGKEVIQTYDLKNEGETTLINISVVPFFPQGIEGYQEFDEELAEAYQGWFSLIDPQIAWGSKFNLPKGETQTVSLKISPPRDTNLKDYYFAVLFITQQDSETGLDSSYSQARIGSNLLITVTDDGNPIKNVEIANFSAPLIIDSFAKLNYSVTLKNIGRSFVKPMGKIIVTSKPFGKVQEIFLAPVNVLVSSSRDVPCLIGNETTACRLDNKFHLGVYKAKLQFILDEETQNYTSEIVTIALPFSLMLGITAFIVLLKMILKVVKQGQKT